LKHQDWHCEFNAYTPDISTYPRNCHTVSPSFQQKIQALDALDGQQKKLAQNSWHFLGWKPKRLDFFSAKNVKTQEFLLSRLAWFGFFSANRKKNTSAHRHDV